MQFLEFIKAVLFGIVEGVTEWLPVSSTGHLILLDTFVRLQVSAPFWEMFQVVIQLGAILAVVLMFFHKLNPLAAGKSLQEQQNTWMLWAKILVAVLPSAVLGLLLDDWMDAYLYNNVVVSIALVVYGVAFMLMEKYPLGPKLAESVWDIGWRRAVLIGCFQCLALIPGTSRSGATILGAILLGVSRSAGAEFSFFLAIPTMLGASGLKIVKFLWEGVPMTATELGVLLVGFGVSLGVSWLVIRGLMEYVRSHTFFAFGVYRVVLGVLVLGYFLMTAL